MRLSRLAVDVAPLRDSRDMRLLISGNVVSGLGTQAELPYQIYVQTGSPFLTGQLGAVELVPLVTLALLGGALADRYDRRWLPLDQVALVATSALLAACVVRRMGTGLGPVRARRTPRGFGAVQNVTRSAIVPNLVAPERLRAALALNFRLYELTLVVGPALGGVDDRRSRGGRRVHHRRGELPGDSGHGVGDGPAAAARAARGARRRPPVDRRRAPLRLVMLALPALLRYDAERTPALEPSAA